MDKKNLFLSVKVSTPTEVLWEGEAKSVTSVNSQGEFDILPLHANFVTLIQNKPIILRTKTGDKQFSFKNAVIYTHKNIARIYGDV